jgi:hypothetical protein
MDLMSERGGRGATEEEREHDAHAPHPGSLVQVDVHGVTGWRAMKIR